MGEGDGVDGYRFARLVHDARERLGLRQHELAAKIGVAQQSVSRWESGAALPPPARAVELADALGLPRSRLLALAGYLGPDWAVVPVEVVRGLAGALRDWPAVRQGREADAAYKAACSLLAEATS